jgi:hypothetical protein
MMMVVVMMRKKIFDVEEITPTSYMHMGTLIFRQPQNPDWREKISYKGKTEFVREKKKENPRLVEKEVAIHYRLHKAFKQDFYESIIIPKNKLVVISQSIDWNYIEGMHNRVLDEVVATCKAKHLRDIMTFRKNWNNEIIAQFFVTLYVQDQGDTRKFHLMTEGRCYEISYEHFARLFGFGQGDANRHKIHLALYLHASKLKFMYPNNKRGSAGTTTDLLPFYTYLNHLFRKMMTPREGDSSNIPSYNQNILVAMAQRPHGFGFCVFDFIWEEI